MRANYSRYEYKYLIPTGLYYKIRNALACYMTPDHFTRQAPLGTYLVRSLYFDTYHYKSYHEKMEGICGRIKYRLRTYSDLSKDRPAIRAELKTRNGELLDKFSAFLTYQDYQFFMGNKHWPDTYDNTLDPMLIEFERHVHLHSLHPKILVEYQREALEPRAGKELGGDLRITFDTRVQSCMADTLFPQRAFFRFHHPHGVVLEIKCSMQKPVWLSKMIKTYGLKYIANSKYAQGVEVARPEHVSPY